MEGLRVLGSPMFTLDASDPQHWAWCAVPGSEAPPCALVAGALHQVATYADVTIPPSDPTIEQFNPGGGPVSLFLVEDQ